MISVFIKNNTESGRLTDGVAAQAARDAQAGGGGQINGSMAKLSNISHQTSNSSEELASIAEEMIGQAVALQRIEGFLRGEAQAVAHAG
jgi:methyl-accepting chemotaxis protein